MGKSVFLDRLCSKAGQLKKLSNVIEQAEVENQEIAVQAVTAVTVVGGTEDRGSTDE
jgi:hypothetical protein